MTQDGGYDLTPPTDPPPPEKKQASAAPQDAGTGLGGSAAPKPGEPGWVPPVPIIEKADAVEEKPEVDPDIEKHKGLALLGYIFFVIPLVAAPNSAFARYHANQGLLSFITLVVVVFAVVVLQIGLLIVGKFVPIALLQDFFWCGFYVLQIAALVAWVALVIQGIIHAANGEKKPLPVIGHWTLIK